MATHIRHIAQRIPQPPPIRGRDTTGTHEKPTGTSFADLLQKQASSIRFSAHASLRMQQRNVTMSPEDVQALEKAFALLEQKGGKDALILRDETAFIVNVPRRTVVTVIDQQTLRDRVFSQIDSALLL